MELLFLAAARLLSFDPLRVVRVSAGTLTGEVIDSASPSGPTAGTSYASGSTNISGICT